MLPTQGYFKYITCPYYDSGLCERPHCQFRHAKKGEADTVCVITAESETNMCDIHAASEDTADMGQSILEQLVSETVKKVLSHPEILPGAIASGSVKSISQSLVNKVVGELKPRTSFLVHTASAVTESPPDSPESHTVYIPSTSVPSYRPTPIAELMKRQGSVPYKPQTSSKSPEKRKNHDYSLPHSKYTKAELCTDIEDWKKLPYIPKAVGSSHPKYSPTHNDYFSSSKVLSYIPSSISSLSSDSNDYVPLPVTSTLNVPDYHPSNISYSNIEANYVPQGLETEHSYTPTIRSELENMSRTNSTSMMSNIVNETMTVGQTFFTEDCEGDSENCESIKEKDCKGDKEKDCGNFTALSGQILPAEKKKKVKNTINSRETTLVKTYEVKQKSSNSSSRHKNKSHSSSQKHTHISNKQKETDIKVKKSEYYKSNKIHKEEKGEKKNAKRTSVGRKNSSSVEVTSLNSKKVNYKDAQSRIERHKIKHGRSNSNSASKIAAMKSSKKQELESKCKKKFHIKANNFSVELPKVKEKSSSSSLKERGYGKYGATLRETMGSSIHEDSFDLELSESDEETVREECFRIFQEYNPQLLPATSVKEVVKKPSQKPERQKLDKCRVGVPVAKSEINSSSKCSLKQMPLVTKLQETKSLSSNSGASGVTSLTSQICSTASTSKAATQKQIATQQASTTARIRIAHVQNVERLLDAKHRMKAELESRQRSKTKNSSATFLKESPGSAKHHQYCKVPQSTKTDFKYALYESKFHMSGRNVNKFMLKRSDTGVVGERSQPGSQWQIRDFKEDIKKYSVTKCQTSSNGATCLI